MSSMYLGFCAIVKIIYLSSPSLHSLEAVPKPDGEIRPITDCSMPLYKSVNNHCENLKKDFKYKSVDNVKYT